MSLRRFLKYHLFRRWFEKPTWNAHYLFEAAVHRLRPGDLVIDAGANLGEITSLMASSGATVHAFEPDPHAFERLQKRVRGRSNVHLYPQALSDRPGTVQLFRAKTFAGDPDFWSQSSSIFADKVNVDGSDGIEVEQVSIIDFIRGLTQPIKILKIDVEGAEVPILEAILENGLMDRIGLIFAETHEKKIPQLAERTQRLRKIAASDWKRRINLDWH